MNNREAHPSWMRPLFFIIRNRLSLFHGSLDILYACYRLSQYPNPFHYTNYIYAIGEG